MSANSLLEPYFLLATLSGDILLRYPDLRNDDDDIEFGDVKHDIQIARMVSLIVGLFSLTAEKSTLSSNFEFFGLSLLDGVQIQGCLLRDCRCITAFVIKPTSSPECSERTALICSLQIAYWLHALFRSQLIEASSVYFDCANHRAEQSTPRSDLNMVPVSAADFHASPSPSSSLILPSLHSVRDFLGSLMPTIFLALLNCSGSHLSSEPSVCVASAVTEAQRRLEADLPCAVFCGVYSLKILEREGLCELLYSAPLSVHQDKGDLYRQTSLARSLSRAVSSMLTSSSCIRDADIEEWGKLSVEDNGSGWRLTGLVSTAHAVVVCFAVPSLTSHYQSSFDLMLALLRILTKLLPKKSPILESRDALSGLQAASQELYISCHRETSGFVPQPPPSARNVSQGAGTRRGIQRSLDDNNHENADSV
jgi:hypothetical protein